jgi:hypothetical protein
MGKIVASCVPVMGSGLATAACRLHGRKAEEKWLTDSDERRVVRGFRGGITSVESSPDASDWPRVISQVSLVQELVIQNRRRHAYAFTRIVRTFGTDDAPLAEHITVLLAGNFLRHLEHHLQERILRQFL